MTQFFPTGGIPNIGMPRPTVPPIPRQGIVETLDAPGLETPQPFSRGAQLADQLMNALGMVGQVTGQMAELKEREDARVEYEDRGLATEHARTWLPRLATKIESGEVAVPDTEEDTDALMDSMIAELSKGHSANYADQTSKIVKPQLSAIFEAKRQTDREKGIKENVALAATAGQVATSEQELRDIIADMKAKYGLTDSEALAQVVLPVMKYAAEHPSPNNTERMGWAQKILADGPGGQPFEPDQVADLQVVYQGNLVRQQRAALEEEIARDELRGANPEDLIARVREREAAGLVASSDALALIGGITSRAGTRTQQTIAGRQVAAKMAGQDVALGREHDDARMEGLVKAGLWNQDTRQPTNPEALALDLRRMDHVPRPVVEWITDAAGKEDPATVAQAATAYILLKRIPSKATAAVQDALPDHVRQKLDMIWGEVSQSSPPAKLPDGRANPAYSARVLELAKKYAPWTKALSDSAKNAVAKATASRSGPSASDDLDKLLRAGLDTWQQEETWWGPLPNPNVGIDLDRLPPEFAGQFSAAYDQSYTMLRDAGIGTPDTWKAQAARNATDQMGRQYIFASIRNELHVLKRRDMGADVTWTPNSERELEQFMGELVDGGHVERGWWSNLTARLHTAPRFRQDVDATDFGSWLKSWTTEQPAKVAFVEDLDPYTIEGERGIHFALAGKPLVSAKSGEPIVFAPKTAAQVALEQQQRAATMQREDRESLVKRATDERADAQFALMDRVAKARFRRDQGKSYDPIADFTDRDARYQLTAENWQWYAQQRQWRERLRLGLFRLDAELPPENAPPRTPPAFDTVPTDAEIRKALNLPDPEPRRPQRDNIH